MGPGRLSRAIPWHRTSLFDDALSLALRLIPDWLRSERTEPGHDPQWLTWLAPGRGAVPDLDRHLDGRLTDIQAGGLGPNTLRFLEAAVRRGMPFDVLPSFVQIGWGANAQRNGLLPFNEANAMFAAALAWAQGIDHDTIRRALSTFESSGEQNPGRYNLIEGLPFQVVVDFAHNPDGVRGICSLAVALPVEGRRLLCSLNVGSRHPAHLTAVAPDLARCFDEFVLGCDPALVGHCPEYAGEDPAGAMVARSRALPLEQGVDPDRITGEVDRPTAIRRALDRARAGDLVVLLADHDEVRRVVDQWRAGSD